VTMKCTQVCWLLFLLFLDIHFIFVTCQKSGDQQEGAFLNQDSCFCQIDAGQLEDCSCTTDKIRNFNTDVHQKLVTVLQGDYFRYFQVNFDKPCKFWSDRDGQCGSKNCAIDTCPADQVPASVLHHKVDTALPEASLDLMNEFCTLDPLEATEGCNYIDLLKNEEKYTGYQGKSAARIWGKIYEDLCFKSKEGDNLSDLCLEEKTFFRIISGLHSSISVHLCSQYLLQPDNPLMGKPAVWGRNTQEFFRRFDPKLTNGKGPEWLKNMFYLYLVELRAIGKAGDLLMKLDYRDEDIMSGIEQIVKSAQNFQYHFDENDLFKSDQLRKGELFVEFKNKFREISHLMDCMGCEGCKLWGKLQVTGIGTALKILFTPADQLKLTRHEVVALLNGFGRVSTSLVQLEHFRQ